MPKEWPLFIDDTKIAGPDLKAMSFSITAERESAGERSATFLSNLQLSRRTAQVERFARPQ